MEFQLWSLSFDLQCDLNIKADEREHEAWRPGQDSCDGLQLKGVGAQSSVCTEALFTFLGIKQRRAICFLNALIAGGLGNLYFSKYIAAKSNSLKYVL